jgi:predicted RecB family nuclease
VIAGLDVQQVEGAPREERVEATLALMRGGAPLIYYGLLASTDLVGEPDLLKRVEHETRLGPFGYVPVDVKLGRATKKTESAVAKPAYAIQLCAYAELLEGIQGWYPSEDFTVDHDCVWQPVTLADAAVEYQDVRAGSRPWAMGGRGRFSAGTASARSARGKSTACAS